MSIFFLLIDALNMVRRIYEAQDSEDCDERVSRALETFVQSLERAVNECTPTHAVAVFDGNRSGWRYTLFPEYKAGRPLMPHALKNALPLFENAFNECGVTSVTLGDYEADDIIATLAVKASRRSGVSVTVLSTDKSFIQLMPYGVCVRDHFRHRDRTDEAVIERYGVSPVQFVDYLAIAGDPVNNITGAPQVGAKTAAKLLREFGSVDTVFSVSSVMNNATGEKLRASEDEVRRAKKLLTLKTDIDVGINLQQCRYNKRRVEKQVY